VTGRRVPPWVLGLGAGLVAGFLVRLPFLGGAGLTGDLTDFTAWAGAIGRDGLGRAYDLPLTFPPVMPWLWAGLGAVVPGFANAAFDAGAADPFVNTVIKLPAVLADLGLAVAVSYALRSRGESAGWALLAGLATALQPAAVFISAIWGQFESLYVLPIVIAFLLAVRGHAGWAGVALAIGLMTKPQALPLAIPFIAFALGRGGVRAIVSPAIAVAVTVGILWAPFVAAGGLGKYADSLLSHSDLFGVLSLHAWNPWWLVQLPFGIEQLVADSNTLIGGVSFRLVGAAIFGMLALAVGTWVARRPTPEGLAWGLVAISLAAFCALTTMHERYLFPAVMILPILWPDRRAVLLWAALGVVFLLNLIAATLYPLSGPGSILGTPLGVAGPVVVAASLVVSLVILRRVGAERPAAMVPA
jgi:dolichyl-phosphate-mannose-protein mannosyltransferase